MKHWGMLFAAVMGLIAGYHTIPGGMVSDDYVLMAVTPDIPMASILTSNWLGVRGEGGFYRPLVTLAWKLDYLLYGTNPRGYHITNVILHILISALVYLLIYQFHEDVWIATISASLFALHPAHHEAIAWISGRTDLFAAFFYLLSITFFIRFRFQQNVNWVIPAASLLCGAAAMFSKEMAYTLPFTVVMVDWLSSRKRAVPKRSSAVFPYFIILVSILGIRWYALGTFLGGYGAGKHLRTDSVIFYYLLQYFEWIMDPIGIYASHGSVAWMVITSCFLLMFLCAFLSPSHRAGAFWFWITLIPAMNLNRSQYLYLPSIGIAWVLGILIRNGSWPSRSIAGNAIRVTTLSSLLIAFGTVTIEKNNEWTYMGWLGTGVQRVIQSLHPTLPDHTRVVLINPPYSQKIKFGIFQNGITEAVRKWYSNRTLIGFRVPTAAQFKTFNKSQDIVFEFDNEKISDVTDSYISDKPHIVSWPGIHFKSHIMKAGDVLELNGAGRPVQSILIDSQLSNATAIRHGTSVAELRVTYPSGEMQTWPIQAGIHTSEWAYDRMDIRHVIQHQRAPVQYSYIAGDVDSDPIPGHTYRARFPLDQPKTITRLKIIALLDKERPGDAVPCLDIRGVSEE